MDASPRTGAEGSASDGSTASQLPAPKGVPSANLANLKPPTIEIGILTKGKPTLSMVLSSLLLQEARDIRIHIVDTSDTPVVNRDDVRFALRLAFDRDIACGYEYSRERERAFSVGRLRLLEALQGPHICLMDDDVVMASSTIARLLPAIQSNPVYGYIAPYCMNGLHARVFENGQPYYSPGGVIYQDAPLRNILLSYYTTTVDVLDRQPSDEKVWEIAFLTELFEFIGRKRLVQPDNISYHLDYQEVPNWELSEAQVIRRSKLKARELATEHLLLREID